MSFDVSITIERISSILIYCFYQTILYRWSLSTSTDTISKPEAFWYFQGL